MPFSFNCFIYIFTVSLNLSFANFAVYRILHLDIANFSKQPPIFHIWAHLGCFNLVKQMVKTSRHTWYQPLNKTVSSCKPLLRSVAVGK